MSTIEEMAEEEAKKEKASYQEYVPRFVEIPIAPRFTEGPPATLRRIDIGALAAQELMGKPSGAAVSITELFPTYRGRGPEYRPPEFPGYGGAPTPEEKPKEEKPPEPKPPIIVQWREPPLPPRFVEPPLPPTPPTPTPTPTPTIPKGLEARVVPKPPPPLPNGGRLPLRYIEPTTGATKTGLYTPAQAKAIEKLPIPQRPPPIEKITW